MAALELVTEQQLRSIHDELGATKEGLKRDVATVKEWAQKQPHLPKISNDAFIEHVLILCKNSVEKCKNVIDMYFTVRGAVPEFYNQRDPLSPEIQKSMKTAIFFPLPKLTPDFCRVSIFKFFDPDASTFDVTVFCKVTLMSIDVRMQEDTVTGDVLIWDFAGGNMSHLTASLPMVKKFVYCSSNASPIRHKEAIVMNAPPYADTLINLTKSFIKKKLADRVSVLSDPADLVNLVPKSVLPREYGGTCEKSINELRDIWQKKLESYREWFLNEGNLKTDESKRPGKSNLNKEIFGIEGSFRKICVD